ncbi:uncharacterized protein LOC117216302 [Bombus bifarius]|uniref:Uncharacterized protein LOC117216302 n=1 Tax=Bombus bifarius TaxID=103933 RepID=A0A6P8MXZ1_9HYME|nr:uncharacterized protein LOC117216302 [Bombus bifarius]
MFGASALDKYPALRALKRRIHRIPAISDWLGDHPANYKGCPECKTLYTNRYPKLRAKEVSNQTPSPLKFATTPTPSSNQTPSPTKFISTSTSYAQAVQGIQNNPNSQRNLPQNSVPNPPNTDNSSRTVTFYDTYNIEHLPT